MFDVFDVHLPALKAGGSIALRRRRTAFGPSDEAFVDAGHTRPARAVMPADGDQETGAAEQASSTLPLAAEVANEAAEGDEAWSRFLGALLSLLGAHPRWRAICASDCDQRPLQRRALAPEGLCRLLDSHRATGLRPIAHEAFPPGVLSAWTSQD